MKNRVNYILLLAIVLFYSNNIVAQQDTHATFYKPSEIPVQIENATSFLVKQKSGILGASMVETAQKMLETFEKEFWKLNTISDSISFNNYNSVQLRNIKHRWVTLQSKLGKSLVLISERTEMLEKEKELISAMLNTWVLTRKNDKEQAIPTDLLNSIDGLEKEIVSSLKILHKEASNLLSIQSGFSNKNIIIETKLITLKGLIFSKQRETFERNSFPLWSLLADSSKSSIFNLQTDELVSTYKGSINNFYEYYETKIPMGIIIFIFILFFTLALKYYSSKIEDDTPTIKKALSLLQRPFAISLLLFLLFLSVATDSASTFEGFIKILMLIPLLVILLKIIDPRLKSGLFVFMILFLVKELKVNTGSDTNIERILLLVVTFLSYFGIYWAMKNKLFITLIKSERVVKLLRITYKVSLVIVSLVLILNVIGYVKLANVLINGFYNSVYATVLLLTANLVFNALLLILLKSKPMQKLKIVNLHSNTIISTASKIIKIAITIAWFAIVLKAFLIYELLFETVTSILVANIGFGSISLSLGDILLFVATIWVSFQISRFLQFILEVDILPQFKLPRGVPGAIISLTKYSIIIVGLLIAFVSIGFDFNKFAILIGALGVGIGFGLQNLVNNFISGIVLIFERPIQTGDVIKVGEITGTVKRIGIRASVVRTFDGAEIIVPNGNLISSELTNWTFSDRFRRMDVAVGVEYGSDIEKVKELLLLAGKDIEGVLDRPAAIVLFQNFGDSSLDFILRSWTKDFDNWLTIESQLRFEINKLFEENNIVIPFPQADINFKNNLLINKRDNEEK